MHIVAWGQTQLFWLYNAFVDSENSRMNYYFSFELTRVIPSIGQPVYTFWLTGYQSKLKQGYQIAAIYFAKLGFWSIYYYAIRWYTVAMGDALFNYAMVKRQELYRAELEGLVNEAKERGGIIKS